MKIKRAIIGISILSVLAIVSCEKETEKRDVNQTVKVYLPASAGENNVFSVLDSGKVVVDTAKNTVNFPIPVYRGGSLNLESFVVDVTVDEAKVNQLIQAGLVPANTVVLPADCYDIDTKDTVKRADFVLKGTITPKVKLSKLPTYAGKIAAIGIKISNPTKFELNDEMSSTVMLIDIDKLVSSYLTIPITVVNPGFESNYTGWATITGAAELKNASGRSGKDLNYWSSSVTSGSVLQTITGLRNGNYTLSAWYKAAGTNMYMVANDQKLALTPQGNWTQVTIKFTVSNRTAVFGFKAESAGGNFGAWEPWCDMDDFTLILNL